MGRRSPRQISKLAREGEKDAARCSKPSEDDLELKAGSVHVKGAPGMLQIARRARRRERIGVPGSRWRRGSCRARGCSELTVDGGPRVRILLFPAESQSLGRIRVRGSRTPAFRAGVRGWLGDAVGRDAQGFPIRANLRQYLCRAIFQYRSAADVVGENPTPITTKSGIPRFDVRQIFEFGSGSGKAEHGALIVPSERQT